ncbi:hypothetical protein [Leadbetterella sp. DM7]|uniref:hypothetical protein n=1 Tax=Leadbetterella sp. DM7 TaxID=3235085 RepID=UPI00349E8163
MNSFRSISYQKGSFTAWLMALVCCLLSLPGSGQQPVRVNVTIMQPVTPYLPQLAADIRGGNAEQSLSDKLIVRVVNTSNTTLRLKLSARIERMSPSPASVSLRPDYQPAQPLILRPQQSIQLDRSLIEETFGNFSRRQLVFDNLDLSDLQQNKINYKLPEGIYRICIEAYDYDKPGQAVPLSTVGTGCTIFTICYTAAAPRFTMPVATVMQQGFVPFTPQSPQIQFAWTPPASTCGLPMGMITYDLEIREMYAGQAVNDARNNPFVFRQQAIATNMFLLDTLKYPHVLQAGRKYVIRVKANLQKAANSPLEIANQGYSEPAMIIYTPKTNPLVIQQPVAKVITGNPAVRDITPPAPTPAKAMSAAMANICEGVPAPLSTTVSTGNITGKDLRVGQFTLHVNQASLAGDNRFKGSGYITWSPYGHPIKLKVTFDAITVSDKGEVLAGEVETTSDSQVPEWASLKVPDNLPVVNNILEAATDKINAIADPIQQFRGENPVNLPLGLNDANLAGVKSTLAITGITFTSGGTNMRVLFTMNVPDANGWLSLAGTNFCIRPDGFSFNRGLLFLPQDKKLNFGGGYELTFRKSLADPMTGAVDTTGKTYLLWNKDGIDKVVVAADMKFPGAAVSAVNSAGKRTGTPLMLEARFAFKKWDNWIASVKASSSFEFNALPGFTVTATDGLYYDHSKVSNPTGLTAAVFPEIYKTNGWETGAAYEGIFMRNLQMTLPEDFLGGTGTRTSFSFKNLVIDENGVSTLISANNILTAGKLGGWAFSIDQLNITVEANVPGKDMKMTGKLGLPISNDRLVYTCLLNTGGEEGLNYQFRVSPPAKGLNVPIWGKATTFWLDPESDFTILKDQYGAAIRTGLSGKLDISLKTPVNVDFTAMTVRNMKIANRSADGKAGFNFEAGQVGFGPGSSDPVTGFNSLPEPGNEQLYANGPYTEETGGYAPAETAAQKKVAGFTVNINSLKPVIGMESQGFKAGFEFVLGVDLGFGDKIGLASTTTLTLYGYIDPATFTPKPDVKASVSEIHLTGEFSNFLTVDGHLNFRSNDPTWGDGVEGGGTVSFMPGIAVDAKIISGTAPDKSYSYFGFAASVFSKGGLAAIGPLVINGFGGGFYHNLTIRPPADLTRMPENGTDRVAFVPKKNSNVFEAKLYASYINTTVLKASGDLKIDITNGAVSVVTFDLAGDIFSDGDLKSKGIVQAKVNMQYDFVADAFDMFIGVDAEILKATVRVPIWMYAGYKGPKAAPGESVEAKKQRLADKGNFGFFLYVGYPAGNGGPESRIGDAYRRIELTLVDMKDEGPVKKAYLGANAYFCLGSELPPFPALPDQVRDFMGGGGNKNSANELVKSMISITKPTPGFMFGASVTGEIDLSLLILRAYATATLGFDVALMRPVPGSCKSPDGTFGLDGWYAVGQAFVYLKMGVDLHVDVGLFSGDVTLAKVQVGAVLLAGLPNPTWMNGRVKVVGEALGGMVRVNKSFNMQIGQMCIPDTDPLDNIKLIAEVGPSKDHVSIFAKPYVVFNLPMDGSDYTFTAMDKDGKETERMYHFFVKGYTVSKNTPGAVDQGEKRFADPFNMTLWSKNALAPDSKYTVTMTCKAEEYYNGAWRVPRGEKYKGMSEMVQTEKISFTTGSAPKTLSNHVVISYPLEGQNYMLKDEFPGKKGIIMLDQYWPEPFQLDNVLRPDLKVTFIAQNDGTKIERNFSVNGNKIEFDLPGTLKNSTTYRMYLSVETTVAEKQTASINLEKNTASNTPKVAVLNTAGTAYGGMEESRTVKLVNEAIEARLINPATITAGIYTQGKVVKTYEPKVGRNIFELIFRTSQFNTFQEKMASFGSTMTGNPMAGLSGIAYDGITATSGIKYATYGLNFAQGPERFDEWEIKGIKRDVGESNSALKGMVIPPLLRVDMPFDKTRENDKTMDALYVTGVIGATASRLDLQLGVPALRGTLKRPDYTINTRTSSYTGRINLTSGTARASTAQSDKLTVLYERDKYFAHDLALLWQAAAHYRLYKGTFDLYYKGMVKEKDRIAEIMKTPGWFSNIKLIDELSSLLNMNAKYTYDKFITHHTALAKGQYGSISITPGYEEYFWLYKPFETVSSKILDIRYKPLPENSTRTLRFSYGFGFGSQLLNATNEDAYKINPYLSFLSQYQKNNIQKSLTLKVPSVSDRVTEISSTSVQLIPFTIFP